MRKIVTILLFCCCSTAIVACSDDSSESSTSNNDLTDVSNDTDSNSADGLSDTTADTSPDIGEPDIDEDPKLAAGEDCPANCQSLGTGGAALCEECDDEYCKFSFNDSYHPYCTKLCDGDSDCRSFGEGWTCDVVCVFDE